MADVTTFMFIFGPSRLYFTYHIISYRTQSKILEIEVGCNISADVIHLFARVAVIISLAIEKWPSTNLEDVRSQKYSTLGQIAMDFY